MKAVSTPWGPSQHSESRADGITSHSTSSHGGYHLDRDRQAFVRKLFPTFRTFAGGPWYEEDQDWAIVALAFPTLFSGKSLADAVSIVKFSAGRERDRAEGTSNRGWSDVLTWVESDAPGANLVESLIMNSAAMV